MGKWLLRGVFALLAFMCISPTPLTQKKAESRALYDFKANRKEFVKIVNDTSLNTMSLATVLGIKPTEEYSIPDNLTSVGINSIYAADGVLYFEYEDSIMWSTPFGILYTNDTSSIDEWYRLVPIENGWYYYRIVS